MHNSIESSRLNYGPVFLLCLLVSLLTSLLLEVVSGRAAGWIGQWPDYQHMMAHLYQPLSRLRWIVGDISEVAFYKHELPALGLLCGAGLAHWAARRGHPWQGFSICYGTGLLPWVLLSSLLGLLFSHLLWGWVLIESGMWQPTFVAFVSLPAATVLLYGAGLRIALTGAFFGALLVTPASLILVNDICYQYQLPVVVGNVGGMAIASVVVFVLYRCFPNLVRAGKPLRPLPSVPAPARYDARWVLRRVLADFSEAPFFGNELASAGLLLGALLAWLLSPGGPAYGSNLLPQIVAGQALASLIGVLLWRRQWRQRGWYPTYIPIVSIVPAAVLTLGGSAFVIVLSASLGALIAPPVAVAISARLPAYMHGYLGNVVSMALCTLVIVPLISLLQGILL